MSRKTFLFELVNAEGKPLKRVTRRCTGLSAQSRAVRLLHKTPGASAAFGYEVDGLGVHSAYLE